MMLVCNCIESHWYVLEIIFFKPDFKMNAKIEVLLVMLNTDCECVLFWLLPLGPIFKVVFIPSLKPANCRMVSFTGVLLFIFELD